MRQGVGFPFPLRVQFVLAIALVLASIPIAILAGSARPELPEIPLAGLPDSPGIGRCVALMEGDVLIGLKILPTENMAKANANRASYAISTYNAVTMIAREHGRPDLASLALDFEFRNPPPGLVTPTVDAGYCYCSNTIWSGDPRTGGQPIGCSGGCGSCTVCRVFKAPKQGRDPVRRPGLRVAELDF